MMKRFIPAYAGNTAHCPRISDRDAVHPRVCGEHPIHPVDDYAEIGSSPRMRGTPLHSPDGEWRLRFIPAYAGNTRMWNLSSGSVPVHPRVCGEHASVTASALMKSGSSPRMRGTHKVNEIQARQRRFIPAYAGNTWPLSPMGSSSAVHPRVCGEHSFNRAANSSSSGSSPRMRGTRP